MNTNQKTKTDGVQALLTPRVARRARFGPNDALDGVVLSAGYELAQTMTTQLSTRSGKVNLHSAGFGFVTESKGSSYFIRAPLARALLNGDQITFTINSSSANPEVQRIPQISREASIMMCEVKVTPSGTILVPDDPCFVPLVLPADVLAELPVGSVISVEIPAFSGNPASTPINVRLLRNLGPRLNDVDFFSLYAQVKYGFDKAPTAELLDPEVMAAAAITEGLGVDTTPYVTIDGASTQDFDDAIFARRRSDGSWTVRVAISDVSCFVPAGSELDLWAAKQTTSVYMPNGHVPMLPPELSLGECSLSEGTIRRAVVMSLHLNSKGKVVSSRVERRQIKSHARLTYAQVAKFLGGKQNIRFAGEVENVLYALEKVYNLLSKARKARGMLDIDEPDPQLVRDESGSWKLVWESRTVAHKVVEEFMLLANQEAANMLLKRYGCGIFRVQEAPDAVAWTELREWAASIGQTLPEKPTLQAMVELVESQASVSPEAHMTAFLKVRMVMQPAKYAVQDAKDMAPHFSLNVDCYTQFTSPIRRYVDLLVHRLLLAPVDRKLTDADKDRLSELADICSAMSYKARQSERSVWDRLKLMCLVTSVPKEEELKGRILRCTSRGVRVLLAGWQCPAWLLAPQLRSQGFSFEDGKWSSDTKVLSESDTISVKWESLSDTLPAHPELLVSLFD